MTGLLALMARSSRRHKELARQAAEKADVRFVGPLAEAITPADRELQSTVFPLLERLLPKVDEQTPLTADQRKALAALPGNSAARPALKVAAIDALGRVGDEQSMRTLRRVAGGDSVPESRRLQRDAALRAIPQLEARLKARAVQGQLLRAAGPATQPDALLRAAPVAGQPEPPSTLLRAGSAG